MHQATGSHNRMCSLLACVAVAGNRSLHADPSAPGPVGPHYCQCLISWRSSDFQEDQGAEHILGREVPCLWSLWDARAVLVGWSSAPRLLLSPELPTVRAQASLRYCPVTSISRHINTGSGSGPLGLSLSPAQPWAHALLCQPPSSPSPRPHASQGQRGFRRCVPGSHPDEP